MRQYGRDMGATTHAILDIASRKGVPTPQEERALVVRSQEGDRDAINELAIRHSRMIVQFLHKYTSDNTSADDAFQMGFLGLIRAAEKSDVEKWDKQYGRMADGWGKDDGPSPFYSYAKRWVMALMAPEKFRFECQVTRGWNYLGSGRASPCSDLQRRALNNISISQVDSARLENGRYGSDEHFNRGVIPEIDKVLSRADPEYGPEHDAAVIIGMAEEVLEDREYRILMDCFSFDGYMTLEQIGDKYGLSRERIRQLRDESLDTIRKTLKRREVLV